MGVVLAGQNQTQHTGAACFAACMLCGTNTKESSASAREATVILFKLIFSQMCGVFKAGPALYTRLLSIWTGANGAVGNMKLFNNHSGLRGLSCLAEGIYWATGLSRTTPFTEGRIKPRPLAVIRNRRLNSVALLAPLRSVQYAYERDMRLCITRFAYLVQRIVFYQFSFFHYIISEFSPRILYRYSSLMPVYLAVVTKSAT